MSRKQAVVIAYALKVCAVVIIEPRTNYSEMAESLYIKRESETQKYRHAAGTMKRELNEELTERKRNSTEGKWWKGRAMGEQ